jgi:hypothetical protein
MCSDWIRKDVEGAPFKIGDEIVVGTGTDETFLEDLKGLMGTVIGFNYKGGKTYPTDPLVMVLIPAVDGLDNELVEGFWKEEIHPTVTVDPDAVEIVAVIQFKDGE